MKSSVKFILLAISSVVLISTSQFDVSAAKPLQRRTNIKSCGDLQDYANQSSWQVKTTFKGFESLQMNTQVYGSYDDINHYVKGDDRLCQLGYVTTVTPMGKEICKGHIYVHAKDGGIRWDYGYHRKSLYSPVYSRAEFCRYIN